MTIRQGKPQIRIGALIWPQHTTWPALMEAGARADALGFDDLWVWDHLLPIQGHPSGPIYEPFMTLAGWASATTRARLGPMVAANTFRNPALLVKMITTLDHMTAGRAILGIGAGWFEDEHRAYGLDFGAGTGERLDRLDEAAAFLRDVLDGRTAAARGPHYSMTGFVNDPRPVQPALPLLIGGSGERKTLATVARYADIWNTGGEIEEVRHKDAVLREWCDRVGRDQASIERSVGIPPLVIRDTVASAGRVARRLRLANPGWVGPSLMGPPAAIVDHIAPYVELGFRRIHVDVPAPFDVETMERFAEEVRPALERL
jgi:alkanesulfonate monooxygenase SsuD/methylene tetrahydromethanopterin reductase-like flavin-dependent oxidoreductase (luciferase family)